MTGSWQLVGLQQFLPLNATKPAVNNSSRSYWLLFYKLLAIAVQAVHLSAMSG
jgi:hypothetical protein